MLLAPLERAQLASAAKTKAFYKNLEEKYESIPPDKRQEPDLKIVHQISDKLKYSLDNEGIREMFENLLISSMTKGQTVLPAFVDAIDRMSTEDAGLFKFICLGDLVAKSHSNTELNLICIKPLNASRVFRYRYFLSWLKSDVVSNEVTDIYNDILKEIKDAESLLKHEDVGLHMNVLKNLGLIESGKTARRKLKNLNYKNYANTSIEKRQTFFHRILKRSDVAKWIKSLYKNNIEYSIIIEMNKYSLTVFGRRLFEIVVPANMLSHYLQDHLCEPTLQSFKIHK